MRPFVFLKNPVLEFYLFYKELNFVPVTPLLKSVFRYVFNKK